MQGIKLLTYKEVFMYRYFEISFKLIREMLGTCSEASIYDQHVIQKAKKEIQKVLRLKGKLTKTLEKYAGTEIKESKEIADLKGILRAYQGILGKADKLPDTIPELLEYSQVCEDEFNELVKEGEEKRATVFMRGEDGWPIISTHMILGNIKENLKIMVNNGDKSITQTKVSVVEMGTLDIKAVDEYMKPSQDIMRNEKGERLLCERPIRFQRMGKDETAIAISEQLPIGTEFKTILRIRAESPLIKHLDKIFDMGKNNGLGAWRGSGNKGAYMYKLKELKDYKENMNGWK